MTTDTMEQETIQTMEIRKEIEIAASVEITFEAVLDELGPEGQMPDGKPFPMKIEPWPGGRWYRDLGKNAGHLWGHVQVIKPPTLLEITGPMFMSYAVAGHLQFRLMQIPGGVELSMRHRILGMVEEQHRRGVRAGWNAILERVKTASERSPL